MTEFSGRGILLDIEGTTSPIAFVYDVMFPFVRRELEPWLLDHWNEPDLQAAVELMARDAGYSNWQGWLGAKDDSQRRQAVRNEALKLMDDDVKATGLKSLQGLIWKSGFVSGELCAEVFDDVPVALKAWNDRGMDVRIYSSGSVKAQKLFFRHTTFGDLLPHFRGHYDTTTGGKKEAKSYEIIAQDMGLSPEEILFVSDVTDELVTARQAGLATVLARRPGNAEVPAGHGFPEVSTFAEIAASMK